jgi:hypothetical protein
VSSLLLSGSERRATTPEKRKFFALFTDVNIDIHIVVVWVMILCCLVGGHHCFKEISSSSNGLPFEGI